MKSVSFDEANARPIRLSSQWMRTPHEWYGDWLRPVPGAVTEQYDPLLDGGNDRPTPLWSELLDLDVRNRDQLQEFFSRRGPLGILPHHLVEARFRPTRLVTLDTGERVHRVAFPGDEDLDEGLGLIAVERPDMLRVLVASASELAALTQEGDRSGVVLWQGMLGDWKERSLEVAYRPFFPTLDGRNSRYPSLHSSEFWANYAESADSVERALSDFRMWTHHWPLRAGLTHLIADPHAYLHHVHPIPIPRGDEIAMGWSFPSLLSIAAVGFLNDLANAQTRVCADFACGKTFRPTRADKRFCSVPCGNRFRARAATQRKHEGKESTR